MKYTKLLLALSILVATAFLPMQASASREMENLGRGVIATYNGGYPSSSVFIAWRMLGTEPNDVGYNVYRGNTKLNSSPITSSCNYLDNGGTANSTYSVAAVINGIEQDRSDPVKTWTGSYLGSGRFMGCQEIPLTPRTGYEANDAAIGDLDGDGEYELILKRLSTTLTDETTAFHFLEAYEMDGTLLWSINMGPNELFAPLEINPIVYDFDGDGRAEVVVRTTEGVTDALGNTIGDTDNDGVTDYRYSGVQNGGWRFMSEGPEFLSVFDGLTGKEIARAPYIERDPISQWGLPGQTLGQYAHRADKCMLTPAYLNGETPSIVITRGIYEKIALEAWDYRNGTLTQLWHFDTDMSGYGDYAQQGNHNLTVGDCDGDGFDEIVYGQMTIDHDGSGLYTTKRGHGDAIHMGKMIPNREGLQIYGVHEHPPYGADLRDAATGEAIWEHTADGDTGRGCAAHIDADHPGYQMWDVGITGTYDCSTQTKISDNAINWGNFLIWWDGDLQREILDGVSESPIINKWNSSGNYGERLVSLYNYPSSYSTTTINSTKANPCISGDLFGDWREEAIFPASDHSSLYIYSTATMTSHRIYTLMHDSMYRTAIAWQCNQYNQPPHPSFYIGAGMSTPPTPDIKLVELDATPPEAPTELIATPGNNSVELDWADNTESDLRSYSVYRLPNPQGSTGIAIIASNLTESAYTDKTIASTTTYYYAVTASDSVANESAYSAPVNITTAEIDPTVEFWDFEDGTEGLSFSDNGTIPGGSTGINGTIMHGWYDNGPIYTNATHANGGNLALHSTYQDGYIHEDTGGLLSWSSPSWTIELAFRVDSASSEWWSFFTKMGSSYSVAESDFYFQRKGTDNNEIRLNYHAADGTQYIVDGTTTLNYGQWYGVAAIVDSQAGTITMYVDEGTGYKQDGQTTGLSGADLSVSVSSANYSIFRDYYNGNQWDNYLGAMDNLRISATALSIKELIPLTPSDDTDADGLSDEWEMEHFGNLNQSGTNDPDSDGDSNETEETNGTSPTISSIPPELEISLSAELLQISWPTNRTGWILQSRTNLLIGNWITIEGSESTNVFGTALEEHSANNIFYKLVYPMP